MIASIPQLCKGGNLISLRISTQGFLLHLLTSHSEQTTSDAVVVPAIRSTSFRISLCFLLCVLFIVVVMATKFDIKLTAYDVNEILHLKSDWDLILGPGSSI